MSLYIRRKTAGVAWVVLGFASMARAESPQCIAAQAEALERYPVSGLRDSLRQVQGGLDQLRDEFLSSVDTRFLDRVRLRGILQIGMYRADSLRLPDRGILAACLSRSSYEIPTGAGATAVSLERVNRELLCQQQEAYRRACGRSTSRVCLNYVRDLSGTVPMPRGWRGLEEHTPRYRTFYRARSAVRVARMSDTLRWIMRDVQPPVQSRNFEASLAALNLAVANIDVIPNDSTSTDAGDVQRANSTAFPFRQRLVQMRDAFDRARIICENTRPTTGQTESGAPSASIATATDPRREQPTVGEQLGRSRRSRRAGQTGE